MRQNSAEESGERENGQHAAKGRRLLLNPGRCRKDTALVHGVCSLSLLWFHVCLWVAAACYLLIKPCRFLLFYLSFHLIIIPNRTVVYVAPCRLPVCAHGEG